MSERVISPLSWAFIKISPHRNRKSFFTSQLVFISSLCLFLGRNCSWILINSLKLYHFGWCKKTPTTQAGRREMRYILFDNDSSFFIFKVSRSIEDETEKLFHLSFLYRCLLLPRWFMSKCILLLHFATVPRSESPNFVLVKTDGISPHILEEASEQMELKLMNLSRGIKVDPLYLCAFSSPPRFPLA